MAAGKLALLSLVLLLCGVFARADTRAHVAGGLHDPALTVIARILQSGGVNANPYTCRLDVDSVSTTDLQTSCSTTGAASPACCTAYDNAIEAIVALPGATSLTRSQLQECGQRFGFRIRNEGIKSELSACDSGPSAAPSGTSAPPPAAASGNPFTCSLSGINSLSTAPVLAQCSTSGPATPACCTAYNNYIDQIVALPGASSLSTTELESCGAFIGFNLRSQGVLSNRTGCPDSAAPAPVAAIAPVAATVIPANPFTCSVDVASLNVRATLDNCKVAGNPTSACCTAFTTLLNSLIALPGFNGLTSAQLENCTSFVGYSLAERGMQSDILQCLADLAPGAAPGLTNATPLATPTPASTTRTPASTATTTAPASTATTAPAIGTTISNPVPSTTPAAAQNVPVTATTSAPSGTTASPRLPIVSAGSSLCVKWAAAVLALVMAALA